MPGCFSSQDITHVLVAYVQVHLVFTVESVCKFVRDVDGLVELFTSQLNHLICFAIDSKADARVHVCKRPDARATLLGSGSNRNNSI